MGILKGLDLHEYIRLIVAKIKIIQSVHHKPGVLNVKA